MIAQGPWWRGTATSARALGPSPRATTAGPSPTAALRALRCSHHPFPTSHLFEPRADVSHIYANQQSFSFLTPRAWKHLTVAIPKHLRCLLDKSLHAGPFSTIREAYNLWRWLLDVAGFTVFGRVGSCQGGRAHLGRASVRLRERHSVIPEWRWWLGNLREHPLLFSTGGSLLFSSAHVPYSRQFYTLLQPACSLHSMPTCRCS